MPSKTRSSGCLSIIFNWILSPGLRLSTRTVRVFDKSSKVNIDRHDCSPKPDLPTPQDYDPPSPSSTRDLGPPPPGYGRYADFDRGSGAGHTMSNTATPGPPRRNLDDVLCFKVPRYMRILFMWLKPFSFPSVERKGTMPTTVGIEMSRVTVEARSG